MAVPTGEPGVEVGVNSQFPKPERNTQFRQAIEIQDPGARGRSSPFQRKALWDWRVRLALRPGPQNWAFGSRGKPGGH